MKDFGAWQILKGMDQIAEYLGCTKSNVATNLIPHLKRFGVVWKESDKKTSRWCSCPILLTIYLKLRQEERDALALYNKIKK